MSKGKRRAKSGACGKRAASAHSASDDDSVETGSVVSAYSEHNNWRNEDAGDDSEESSGGGSAMPVDDTEEKVKVAIEGATTAKSAQARSECFQFLKKTLSNRYADAFVFEQPTTLTDVVEKGLKRGRGDERSVAACVGALLCVHWGPNHDSSALYEAISAILITIIADAAVSVDVRQGCASCLAMCCFIADSDNPVTIDTVMTSLYGVLCGGGRIAKVAKEGMERLHAAALLAWALLLTICTSERSAELIDKHLGDVVRMLGSDDVDLRIAAGHVIAIMFEIARLQDEDYMGGDKGPELCDLLQELATDSQKFRAKKDRSKQRSNFRDIYRAVKEYEDCPTLTVRFGRGESVVLDSWCRRLQYDAFCDLLGGAGMQLHLTRNELVRDVFGLGAPRPLDALPAVHHKNSPSSKFERHMVNMAHDRARTKCRSKLRDKRADYFAN